MDELEDIFISIASYRDRDLANTVNSCFENAKNKNNLFFSVFSQAEDNEHPNLDFIPKNQIRFVKSHWSESMGVCWARAIVNRSIHTKYFLQIDSHSRFDENWDEKIINGYKKSAEFWGERIIVTNYPNGFEIDWDSEPPKDKFIKFGGLKKLKPFYSESAKMIAASSHWDDVIDKDHGDECFFFSANSAFCKSSIIKEIPYDPELYFIGEEPSMALRAYTRGIRLISPNVEYMYTNYNRENGRRDLHWENHESWWELNKKSHERLNKIMKGDTSLGVYGIGSEALFEQYQKITGLTLKEYNYLI